MITIRKAVPGDAPAALAIREAAILHGCQGHYADDVLRAWADDSSTEQLLRDLTQHYYVLEVDDRPVATGMLDAATGRIDAIFVVPQYMQRGLAARMLAHLEQVAVRHALDTVMLDATLNAAAFYRRQGYAGERESLYRSPKGLTLRCIPMTKRLTSDGEAVIELVASDPSWPGRFAAERDLLETTLAPWLAGPIEHVGSTAVPGLAAKPVIDIMAGVASLAGSRAAIDAAASIGYCYFAYRTEVMHWFCKPSAAHRTHHLHLVPHESTLWRDRLLFRDTLREDARIAGRYAALKQQLAERYRHDREAYTNGKTAFVEEVLASARARRG